VNVADRDGVEVDALRTDRYLDALLAAHERRALDTPSDAELDTAVRTAALRLQGDVTRFHPSFRFEERLSRRLAEIASTMHLPAAAGAEGHVVTIGAVTSQLRDDLIDPLGPDPEAAQGLPRQLVIGGAITSAALSIAGAAFVAWWRLRPPTTPMARAVRAACQWRLGRPLAAPTRRRGGRERIRVH
jgi:hypothetical protein